MVNGLTPVETNALWAVLAIGVLTVGYALVLRQLLLRQEQGTEQMQTVAGYFSSGAAAYLSGQVRLILLIALLLAAILGASAWFTPPSREAVARFGADTARLWLVAGRAAAVLLGALSGYLVGQIGVSLTAASIVRTTAAARKGYNPALQVAYRSGAATGLLTVGLGLLGSTLLFLVFGPASADILLSFALGAVVATLVSRVSGGVYATATTMGVDIASKGEQGVAADDPRNAASIATVLSDNADNAGGIATDIFGSFEIALVVSIVLGLVLGDFTAGPSGDGVFDLRFALFPLVVRGIGALASLIGNALVRTDDRQRNAQAAINRGLLLATLLTVPALAAANVFLMAIEPVNLADPVALVFQVDWSPFLAAVAGIVLALVLGRLTEYFTSTRYNPAKAVGQAARSGATSSSMSGLAVGFQASAWVMLVIALALLSALELYADAPIPVQTPAMFYGVALIATGMLTLTGNIVAMSGFGAVASSANQVGQQQGLEKNPRNALEDLEAVGTPMKMMTRGVAAGAAVLTVVALLGTVIISSSALLTQYGRSPLTSIDLMHPLVFIGLLLGGILPLLCAALTLRSAARVAVQVAEDIHQQFEQPDVMQRATPPDYAHTVGVAAAATQRDVLLPGAIAVLLPVFVGFLLGLEALVSFLGGVILASQVLSLVQSNAGGAWTSARRYIEDGNFGGKNSEAHRAAVVTDMIGNPLKATAGPALIPLMKVSGLVALAIAPLLVFEWLDGPALQTATLIGLAVSAVVVGVALWQGNRQVELGTKKRPGSKTSTKSREAQIRH